MFIAVYIFKFLDRTNVAIAALQMNRDLHFHARVCAALAAVGCVSASLLPHPLARVAGLAFVPVGVYGFDPPFWCLPTALLRGTAAAAGIALVGSLGHVGGFVGPYVVGLLTDTTAGASGALLGLGCLSLSAAALCLVLRRQSAIRWLVAVDMRSR